MNVKLGAVIATVTIASLLFSVYQPGSAVPYYGHDGSVDSYLEKVKVKKLKSGNLWAYFVKACATDRTLGVAAVVMKSDLDTQVLGVNKNIPVGKCSNYAVVMKAKDSNTLGAELIEKHEALEKFQELSNSMPSKSKKEISSAIKSLNFYRNMLGGLV